MADENRTALTFDQRPRWVDVYMIEQLKELRTLVDEAIISVHRINAINAVAEIQPWTEAQFDFVEQKKLRPIARLVRSVAPRDDS